MTSVQGKPPGIQDEWEQYSGQKQLQPNFESICMNKNVPRKHASKIPQSEDRGKALFYFLP